MQNYGDGFWPDPVDGSNRAVADPPANAFDVMDTENWITVIGSGRGWPMDVASASIWTW